MAPTMPAAGDRPEGPGQPLVRAQRISRHYGAGDAVIKAVNEASWELHAGKLYALRGRSGSGKTTLLNLIGALDKPTQGEVFFADRQLDRMSEHELTELRRHRMGFIFQSFALLPVLSAYENVELVLRIAGKPPGERQERAREVLRMVGLAPRMRHRPFELSGGEQQRVAIARAIANRPSLLIADEPTAELDSVTGLEIMMLFRHVVDTEGVTAVIATHDPALGQIADETYVMADGRLRRTDEPLDFDLPELVQHIEIVGPARPSTERPD